MAFKCSKNIWRKAKKIAEEDYTWASVLANKVIESRDDSKKTSELMAYLKDIKMAVEKVDLPSVYYDEHCRSDTPFLNNNNNNEIRQRLTLMYKDELEIAQKLSRFFGKSFTRSFDMTYKVSFLESLIALLENHQSSR